MSNTQKKRLTLFLNPALIKHARAQAVIEDLTVTQLIENALIKYLPKETIIKKIKLD
ncbi:hypothetical protein GW927_04575 [Candidatus Pacearchaeota archaeon]|nr:hypothetical protein [Candidatus Pacearchaeota archaeon]